MESLHKLFKVGQGRGGGGVNRSYNTITGVRETSAFEARGYDGGTGSRPRVDPVRVEPPQGGVRSGVSTLRRCQSWKASNRAECM